MDLRVDDFEYDLPKELIAQEPARHREDSRLLVLERGTSTIRHERFADLRRFLRAGDVLVANRSRVIPARLAARKSTGGHVELLLLRPTADDRWVSLARPSRKLREGAHLQIGGSQLNAVLEENLRGGEWIVHFHGAPNVQEELRRVGSLALPPYIRNSQAPQDRYQTVYADREGSVAAPTAGLHFSSDLLSDLEAGGVEVHFVTLHVGLGTFRPVTVDRIADHKMHPEWGEVPPDVAHAVNTARREGRRVVAVGTTSTRLLETAAESGTVEPFQGETSQFIYPGYRFRVVDALLTNFHLPRSTLLMLVSAFAGRETILDAYSEAVREQYRFFSFGDAMLIL